LLILHVSDIHFKSPECLDPATDPDFAIRSLMMRDLAQQIEKLGNVGAILIGGDVAFKAAKDEYETAWHWIQQLAEISGCPAGRIFVVPGNHDVDRGMIRSSVGIQNVQHAISSAPLDRRERVLRQQLGDADAGQTLFKSHSEYNEFAAPLGCQIWPGKPFWHQDVDDLGHGVTLRIYGLTSSLLSGQRGENDEPGGLYLSPLQTVLYPAPNTANLVLIHHPPEWLSDGEAVDEALNTRASFHLLGHKHKQRATMAEDWVRLGAGAVNPDRGELPYEPGYNLIDLQVMGTGAERAITVELHQRTLQPNPERFRSIETKHGDTVFRTKIVIPEERPIPVPGAGKHAVVNVPSQDDGLQEDDAAGPDAEAAMGDEDTRDLLYRFWRLDSSQRREIASKLDLLEEDEKSLPEPERYGRALIRAAGMNKINEVAAEVARLESL